MPALSRAACAGDEGELTVRRAVLPRVQAGEVTAVWPGWLLSLATGMASCPVLPFCGRAGIQGHFMMPRSRWGVNQSVGGPRPSTRTFPFPACELVSPDFSFSPSKKQPVREETRPLPPSSVTFSIFAPRPHLMCSGEGLLGSFIMWLFPGAVVGAYILFGWCQSW